MNSSVVGFGTGLGKFAFSGLPGYIMPVNIFM